VPYSVVADEIVMDQVAALPEPAHLAFVNLLMDLRTDPWSPSTPEDPANPNDLLRRRDIGPSHRYWARYWIADDQNLVRVVGVFERSV
jgi:hypothetical protein